jgi:hypothetical protein
MTYDEYRAEAVGYLVRKLACTPEEASSECGDVQEMQDDGLSPADAAYEIILAGSDATT